MWEIHSHCLRPRSINETVRIRGCPYPIQPRYNISPSNMIPAIISDKGKNRIGLLRWGLVPSFSVDEKLGNTMINARAETLMVKPSFRNLLPRKRCLLIADSFYEWAKSKNGKAPIRFLMKDESIFSFAGLYDTWTDKEGRIIHTCTIITTKPNSLVADVHDRMPAIIPRTHESFWLDRSATNLNLLKSLLQPFDEKLMMAYPVSPIVGSPKNDVPDCIVPISSEL